MTHGICLTHKGNVLGNPRSTFDSSQTTYQGILHSTNPSTMNSFLCGNSTEILWLYSKDCRCRKHQFDKFPTPSSFSCWRIRFKTQASSCSDFPSEAVLWIKEVEMVDSVDELKNLRVLSEELHGPNFEVLDARIASALNRIIHNFHFTRRGQSEGTKKPKKRAVSFSRKTDLLT